MARYPVELVHTHRLFGRRRVTIRPIRADDGEKVRYFLAATSEDSRYNRFHECVAAPSSALVHFLTDVDYDLHMALVCTVGDGVDDEVVGEARYVANPGGQSCDFGILIEDAWRKSGIAGLLMETLIRAARERGFAVMEGFVLADNAAMLRFAHALGFEIEPLPDDIRTVRITLKLQPDAERRREAQSEAAVEALPSR